MISQEGADQGDCDQGAAPPASTEAKRVYCALCLWPTISSRLARHWKSYHSEVLCARGKKSWDGQELSLPPADQWFDANALDWIDDPSKPAPVRNKGRFTPTKAAKANLASQRARSAKQTPKTQRLGKRNYTQRTRQQANAGEEDLGLQESSEEDPALLFLSSQEQPEVRDLPCTP